MIDTRSEIRSNTRALKLLVAAVLFTTAAVPVLASGAFGAAPAHTVPAFQSANSALDAPSENKTPVYQVANGTPDAPAAHRTPVYRFS